MKSDTVRKGTQQAPHRSLFNALGMTKEEMDKPLVGVDATSKQQEAIQKGEELGVLSQNPYAMGYQTMWAAIQSTAPKKETKIDKKVLLDPVWIDAENIKSEDIANYLYN